MRPYANDRNAHGRGGSLNGERRQEPQPAAVLVAVAYHCKAHVAIFQARHGRRQEAWVEEHVGLDRAGAQKIELVDEFETGGSGIDGQPPFGPACGEKLDLGEFGGGARKASQVRHDGAGRSATGFLKQGQGGHQATLLAGMKMNMAMPSLRQTIKLSAAASKSVAIVIDIAAPHRWKGGIRAILSAMLSPRVSA